MAPGAGSPVQPREPEDVQVVIFGEMVHLSNAIWSSKTGHRRDNITLFAASVDRAAKVKACYIHTSCTVLEKTLFVRYCMHYQIGFFHLQ